MGDRRLATHVELVDRFGAFGQTAADKLVEAFGSPPPELAAEIRDQMVINLDVVLAEAGKAHALLADALGALAVTAFEMRLAEHQVAAACGQRRCA